jgi:hypothetical protein
VRRNGYELRHDAPKAFQADRDVVLAACQQKCWVLQYASDDLKAHKEVALLLAACCQQHGLALDEDASADLEANKEVVLAACWQLGSALRYTSDEFKADKRMLFWRLVMDMVRRSNMLATI